MWKTTTATVLILGGIWYSQTGEGLKSKSCEASIIANAEMRSIIYLHQELHRDEAFKEDETTLDCNVPSS